MPSYDYRCETCDHEFERILPISQRNEQVCDVCEGPVERVFKANAVIPDDIPGGVLIENGTGIVNPDGSPKRYYSKSELNKAAEKAGWTNYVVHRGDRGSDKNKHTTKWY